MAMTPKQDRNGVPGPDASGPYTAQPGPDASGDIRSAMRQAQSVATARKTNDHLMVPPSDPHTEWDAGLAVNEPAGEA